MWDHISHTRNYTVWAAAEEVIVKDLTLKPNASQGKKKGEILYKVVRMENLRTGVGNKLLACEYLFMHACFHEPSLLSLHFMQKLCFFCCFSLVLYYTRNMLHSQTEKMTNERMRRDEYWKCNSKWNERRRKIGTNTTTIMLPTLLCTHKFISL